MNKLRATVFLTLIVLSVNVNAQNKKLTATAWDGMIVAGYVNDGAYVNLGGPAIKLIKKPVSVGLGMLPTLRIKEDKVAAGAKKNSLITPTLGFGFTITYKHLAIQLPFYYNLKSPTTDGKWNIGAGIGYKF